MFIYRLTNTVNGKVYIGQTIDRPKNRLRDHLTAAKRGEDSPLCRAIRKYGEEAFLFEVIISDLNADTIDAAEIEQIALHRSYIRDQDANGYNQTRGGKGWSSDVCRAQAKTRKKDGYAAAAKKRANRMVAEGTHNFVGEAGSKNAKKRNAKWVKDGTHPSFKTRTCPNCGHEGRGVGIFRWHFDRCPNRERTLPSECRAERSQRRAGRG